MQYKKTCFFRTAVLFVLTLSVLLGGCRAATPEPADGGISFTDALGRTVTVGQPKRVATLLGSFADIWMLAGGTVCASTRDAWEDFELTLDDAVNLGGTHSPSLEALLSADPDLVLASASTAADIEMKDALESAGITVAYFDVDCFEEYLSMLQICTDITKRKDLYEQNGLRLRARIQADMEACAQAELPDEEKTVLVLRVSAGLIKAKGSEGTILGEMLRDLGCINIADSDGTLLENLSIESIIRLSPYRIFVVTMGSDTQKAMENLTRMMDENPAWRTLDAVQSGRVYTLDKKLFNTKPNAKWADAYDELVKILLAKTE